MSESTTYMQTAGEYVRDGAARAGEMLGYKEKPESATERVERTVKGESKDEPGYLESAGGYVAGAGKWVGERLGAAEEDKSLADKAGDKLGEARERAGELVGEEKEEDKSLAEQAGDKLGEARDSVLGDGEKRQ